MLTPYTASLLSAANSLNRLGLALLTVGDVVCVGLLASLARVEVKSGFSDKSRLVLAGLSNKIRIVVIAIAPKVTIPKPICQGPIKFQIIDFNEFN